MTLIEVGTDIFLEAHILCGMLKRLCKWLKLILDERLKNMKATCI